MDVVVYVRMYVVLLHSIGTPLSVHVKIGERMSQFTFLYLSAQVEVIVAECIGMYMYLKWYKWMDCWVHVTTCKNVW